MWLFLGLASGLFFALQSMASKKALEGVNQYLAAFAYAAFSLPFLLLALFWQDLAAPNFTFWWSLLLTSILNVISAILLMKALKIGELSLTMPFLAFSPVFLIFTSKLILGELPKPLGIWGIVLVVMGAYFLEAKKETGILGPFKALAKNKGGQLALSVAFIYSISANLDKIVIQNSNAITRNLGAQLLMALMLLFFIKFKSDQKLKAIVPQYKILLIAGIFAALTLLSQMAAFTMNIVPYVISLKRTSALFSVILGFIVFKEKNIKPKLLGSALMVAGVFIISMS